MGSSILTRTGNYIRGSWSTRDPRTTIRKTQPRMDADIRGSKTPTSGNVTFEFAHIRACRERLCGGGSVRGLKLSRSPTIRVNLRPSAVGLPSGLRLTSPSEARSERNPSTRDLICANLVRTVRLVSKIELSGSVLWYGKVHAEAHR